MLARVLPSGKQVHKEWIALNPRRSDRSLGSFKVNRFNGKWCDFATGDKGDDPVSLVAYVERVSQLEAAPGVQAVPPYQVNNINDLDENQCVPCILGGTDQNPPDGQREHVAARGYEKADAADASQGKRTGSEKKEWEL